MLMPIILVPFFRLYYCWKSYLVCLSERTDEDQGTLSCQFCSVMSHQEKQPIFKWSGCVASSFRESSGLSWSEYTWKEPHDSALEGLPPKFNEPSPTAPGDRWQPPLPCAVYISETQGWEGLRSSRKYWQEGCINSRENLVYFWTLCFKRNVK